MKKDAPHTESVFSIDPGFSFICGLLSASQTKRMADSLIDTSLNAVPCDAGVD